MKKREGDIEREQEQFFNDRLKGHLEQWDSSIVPPPVHEEAFARLVREGKEELRGRRRAERYLFWLVSAFVLGGMLLLWQSSYVFFAILQAFAFAGAGIFLIVGFFRSNRARRHQR
ncbi:YxlC family protein [Paenibacillus sacheonensis]|uniref:YxlC family protein n=1 Tax=Paenibacillus sacheonensis TaxID=742054 RepID=A0A7X4YP66_9BACL|nr:YxlC family protein [Paenibacillus sacheonensis]MBM7565302.1 hypothetical protein [Paenibacillus sacheonensis]NBC69927.1 hypothetical protein [Paenibacillus sacheonensis]